MPIRRAVLMIRQAISPRLAIKIRLNMPYRDPDPSRPHGFAVSSWKSQIEAAARRPRYDSVAIASSMQAAAMAQALHVAGNPRQDQRVHVGGLALFFPIGENGLGRPGRLDADGRA